jgi:hypothetical protein
LGQLLHFSLIELGYRSKLSENYIDKSAQNIIIGCHLLKPNLLYGIPNSSIIVNTEQLQFDEMGWNHKIYSWASHFETWDYSEKNCQSFLALGIKNIKHLQIGYQPEIRRLNLTRKKDIDVLFYGQINDRRRAVLEALVKHGLRVEVLTKIYGAERDAYIERAKVVLNLHYFKSEIFEIVRVFYLLSNSVAVVGEVNQETSVESRFLSGFSSAKYEELVGCCKKLVNSQDLLEQLRLKSFAAISQYPQSIFTRQLIS